MIREGDRFLLARTAGSDEWGLLGGGVEPGEDPDEAIVRELQEEIGARVRVTGIVGAYGGESLVVTYPNGDRVSYVSTAFACELLDLPVPDDDEVVEVGWFTRAEIAELPHPLWVDRMLADVR